MDAEPVAGRDAVDTVISKLGVVPVAVIDDAARAVPLGEALLAGGLPCAEITFRTDAAPGAIAALVQAFPEMAVGAGTVLTVDQAGAAVAAGARFVVSPHYDESVVEWCLARDVLVIPGAMTPTEVARAADHGVRLVKFFPAEPAGGVAALKAMAAVFPDIEFFPTGGINAANLGDYLRLPMVAACGGSWVAPRRLVAAGDFATIESLVAEAAGIVRSVRGDG